jgi:N-acetylmuramoyl-L-alanine amidase
MNETWKKIRIHPKNLLLLVAVTTLVVILPFQATAAPLIREGSLGDYVETLQKCLLELGYDPGPVDGDFGPLTKAALKAFQSSSGLYPDGICGPLTWAALERAGGTSRSSGPLRGKVIAIDAGHGGAEPGAISVWGDKEKDFTLAMATKVRAYLESLGATVVMTRYGDYSPGSDWNMKVDELLARVSLANSRGADLFVSIHINAYPKDPNISGVMGFYRKGSELSKALASRIAQGVSDTTGLPMIDVQVGPYYVLNNTYMPAALIEVGFMTNYHDVSLLRQNWFLDSAAQGIARGIRSYLGR